MRKESDILVKAGITISSPITNTSGTYQFMVLSSNQVQVASGAFTNGLTQSTGGVKLGGSLTQNTSITAGTYTMSITSSVSGAAFSVTAASATSALSGSAATGTGVYGTGTTGVMGYSTSTGVHGWTTSGTGIYAYATSGIPFKAYALPTSTNTVVEMARITRMTSGTAANGIGGSLNFEVQSTTGAAQVSNKLISKFTNATDATRTSQFIITGLNSGSEADVFTISGNGSVKLYNYGSGSKTGTAVYYLCVDSAGNVIERSI